ncbi:putative MATE family efflux protein [Breznakia blatticola]|uniref:Probable multidrug resistance protein NorM n=1 Tax=Breznakia blatticola TaxID=1754012 RepID=A0A4R7ZFF3_9FIRM|nr:MATE family efflux transporter [Breznakia blatticola]TDW16383.1 putative MATE family efflux protein [Breznakia blatticola]
MSTYKMRHTKISKPFLKRVLYLALPVVIQQLLVNLLSIADTLMIGGISEEAISAVTVANKFFFIFNLAVFGLANGVGIYIAQYFGAKNHNAYHQTFRFGLRACFWVGCISTIYLCIFPESVITFFVSKQSTIQLALEYLEVVRYSYIPFALTMMIAVAYRVIGLPKIPMVSGAIAFVSNVVLNYVLIFGHFGFAPLSVQGAALATMISRFLELGFLVILLFQRNATLHLGKSVGKMQSESKYNIIKNTIPLIFNEIIWSVGLSVVFMNYCYVNEAFIPALTVVDNVSSLVYVAFAGCAAATGAIVGNDLGANEMEQARKDSMRLIKIGLAIYVVGSVLVLALTPVIPKAFSLGTQNTKMAIILLIIKAMVMWTQGYAETCYYILRAGGDTNSVLAIDGLFIVFGPTFLSILTTRVLHLDLIWVFACVEGVNILKVFIATHFYHKENWVKNITLKEEGNCG